MKDFGKVRIKLGKKASLSLSINAIVVLILAITMLGLGLAFMKGLFSKTTKQLEQVGESIRDQLIEEIRRSGAKLTFDKEDVRVKRGDTMELYFGVKNVLDDTSKFGIKPSCETALDTSASPGEITFSAFPETRQLANGEIDVQKMIIESEPDGRLTTWSCLLEIMKGTDVYAKKSFFVTVE